MAKELSAEGSVILDILLNRTADNMLASLALVTHLSARKSMSTQTARWLTGLMLKDNKMLADARGRQIMATSANRRRAPIPASGGYGRR